MYDDRLWVGVGRTAGVLARIGLRGPLHEQVTDSDIALLRDDGDASPGRIVVDLLVIMRPMYTRRRLRAVLHHARQIYRAAAIDVHLWTAQDCCYRFWNITCTILDRDSHILAAGSNFRSF